MLKLKILIVFTMSSICLLANGEFFDIALFHDDKVEKLEVLISRGQYEFSFQSQKDTLKKGDRLAVSLIDNNLSIWYKGERRNVRSIKISGLDYVNHFHLIVNDYSPRKYDDNLVVTVIQNSIKIINQVDVDHYVAGVVEAEAGYNLPLEYYKLQAILCRTYGLKNRGRHGEEGYDLCSSVHCQVYKEKCTKQDIVRATSATSGLVVVDNDLQLIGTFFHSNCGGETANSEDVWVSKLSYLRSVYDPYCANQPHSYWQKEIHQKQFLKYLDKCSVIDSSNRNDFFVLCQDSIRFDKKKLHQVKLTKIRNEFKLNSTFFSIEKETEKLTFFGKGFGHGVGLCQEGGIVMAQRGFSYVDILKFYYTNIHIVNLKALQFFKN